MKRDFTVMNEVTRIVKTHFDNDEDLSIAKNTFVTSLVSCFGCQCLVFDRDRVRELDEGYARDLIANYLKDLFNNEIMENSEESLNLVSDLFDFISSSIDFQALARFYIEETLSKYRS